MKKLVTLLTVLLFTAGFQVAAIGLPNNAYIQKKAENHHHFSEKNETSLFEKSGELMVTKINNPPSNTKKSALDASGDIGTYAKTLVMRFVNFIAVTLLGLFSANHSMDDAQQVFHSLFITNMPPRC